MSHTELELLYAIIERKPNDVARVMEQLDSIEQIHFFKALPTKQTANVFSVLLPHIQAAILPTLEQEQIQDLCECMSINHLAALIRHCHQKTKTKITNLLPLKRKTAVKSLLHYPNTAVGAWLSPTLMQVSMDYSCQQAYKKVLRFPNEYGWLLITDKSHKLVGRVQIKTLLKKKLSTQPVKKIMEKVSISLPAKLSLSQATKHSCWQTESWVPIVDSNGWFIGTLSEKQLKHAQAQQQKNLQPIHTGTELSNWYSENLVEFAGTFLNQLLKGKV